MKSTQQWCEKNLINNINLMNYYSHIEILPKEVCDVVTILTAFHKCHFLQTNNLGKLMFLDKIYHFYILVI